jgi:hypothetical protein
MDYLAPMLAQALHEEREEQLRTYQRLRGYAVMPRRPLPPDPVTLAYRQTVAWLRSLVMAATHQLPISQRMTEARSTRLGH